MEEIKFQPGFQPTLVVHVVIACLLNKCVSLWGKEEYKFQLKIKIMPVEQPFGFEVSLKSRDKLQTLPGME